MKHVKPSYSGRGVAGGEPCASHKPAAPEPSAGWERKFMAIDERVHYVGPVLEHILHLDHDTWPGTLRE